MQHRTIFLLTALLFNMLLNACSTKQNRIQSKVTLPKTPTKTIETSIKENKTQVPIKTSREKEALKSVQSLLTAGEYPAALIFISNERANGLPEHALEAEHLLAINGSLKVANGFISKEDYLKAGILLYDIQTSYPHKSDIATRIDLSEEQISEKIESCANELMETGLLAYRAGQLNNALKTWQQIIAFVPDHAAALKAIETTEIQLQNLNSL